MTEILYVGFVTVVVHEQSFRVTQHLRRQAVKFCFSLAHLQHNIFLSLEHQKPNADGWKCLLTSANAVVIKHSCKHRNPPVFFSQLVRQKTTRFINKAYSLDSLKKKRIDFFEQNVEPVVLHDKAEPKYLVLILGEMS